MCWTREVRGALPQWPRGRRERDDRHRWWPDTLDEIVESLGLERLDVSKADIEGMEAVMLDGASQVFERFSPLWMLEIEQRHLMKFGRSADEIFTVFADRGYTCLVHAEERWHPIDGPVLGRRN